MKIKSSRRLWTSVMIPVCVLFVAGIQGCGPKLKSVVEVSGESTTSSAEPTVPTEPTVPSPNPLSCASGTHAEGTLCVSNTRSCSVANGIASQIWTGSSYGLCTVISCNVAIKSKPMFV